mgnify:FL=1
MKKIIFLLALIVSTNLFGQLAPSDESKRFHNVSYGSDNSIYLDAIQYMKISEKQLPQFYAICDKANELFKYCVDNDIDIESLKEIGRINYCKYGDFTGNNIAVFSVTIIARERKFVFYVGHTNKEYLIDNKRINHFSWDFKDDSFSNIFKLEMKNYLTELNKYNDKRNIADEKINAFLNK